MLFEKASLPITARGRLVYRFPHGLWQQHGPQKSIWPQAAAQASVILMSSGGDTDHEHHVLRLQHRPQIPARPPGTE